MKGSRPTATSPSATASPREALRAGRGLARAARRVPAAEQPGARALRNLAVTERPAPRSPSSCRGARARARPRDGRLRRQRRAALDPARSEAYAERLALILSELSGANPGRASPRRPRPRAGTSWPRPATGAGACRGIAALNAVTRTGCAAHGVPASRSSAIPGLSEPENFATTACTRRRSATGTLLARSRLRSRRATESRSTPRRRTYA